MRRIKTGDKPNEKIVDEKTAVCGALGRKGRSFYLGGYAVYLDNCGRKICSEFLGEESPLSSAAIGACRHKTQKLLIVGIKQDGEVGGRGSFRKNELSELLRLLEILEIEFVDYIETDGTEFFSLRRAVTRGDGLSTVFDAEEIPYEEFDFVSGTARDKANGSDGNKQRE